VSNLGAKIKNGGKTYDEDGHDEAFQEQAVREYAKRNVTKLSTLRKKIKRRGCILARSLPVQYLRWSL
jgi:hypothetical protein